MVNLGCADLQVDGALHAQTVELADVDNLAVGAAGVLDGGSARIALGGDVSQSGTLIPGSSTVAITDTCGNTESRVSGNATFHDLSVISTAGKKLVLEAGQTTTVSGMLTLQGVDGHLLQVRSSVPGTTARIAASTQQSIQFVDVADNRAVGAHIAPGYPSQYKSVAGSNVFSWFDYDESGQSISAKRIPTLSGWALAAVALLLAGVGVVRTRRARSH
ncbi:hypothetical protein CCO03_14870 [Comamonas serinivorans]|uniref:IPTL-CTERM protein sorting domain-containing protein n=1 Tax=Comamonas serinivorans TaxID=1082851 RepID=A0A1Y0EQ60_9BURK|nr:hypothetical protein CCO03_14870 [Comamonas serinivorans]